MRTFIYLRIEKGHPAITDCVCKTLHRPPKDRSGTAHTYFIAGARDRDAISCIPVVISIHERSMARSSNGITESSLIKLQKIPNRIR